MLCSDQLALTTNHHYLEANPSMEPAENLVVSTNESLASQTSHLFQGSSGFQIVGGQFILGNVNNTASPLPTATTGPGAGVTESSPNLSSLAIGAASFVSTPSSVEVLAECEIYRDRLLYQKRGFPLYIPEPQSLPEEYRTRGASIGDVGSVTPEGAFDFLFNIYYSAAHPINANGVPDKFRPLRPIYRAQDTRRLDFHPGEYVSTPSVQEPDADSFSDADEFPGAEFIFSCTGPNGAVLALPHGSSLEKLRNLEGMRRYAAENAESWYKYINTPEGRGRRLVNGFLYLITGCEKAQSWGIATFQNVATDKEFRLRFKPRSNSADVGYKYRWRKGSPAHKRQFRSTGENLTNQTLFIHGFSISLGEERWERLFPNVAIGKITGHQAWKSSQSGFVPFGSQTSWFSGSFSFMRGSKKSDGDRKDAEGMDDDGVGISEISTTPQVFHPSHVINQYLVKKVPLATAVITHDDDWCHILREDDRQSVIANPSDWVQRLFQQFTIAEESGMVYLVPKDLQPNSTDSRLSSVALDTESVERFFETAAHDAPKRKRAVSAFFETSADAAPKRKRVASTKEKLKPAKKKMKREMLAISDSDDEYKRFVASTSQNRGIKVEIAVDSSGDEKPIARKRALKLSTAKVKMEHISDEELPLSKARIYSAKAKEEYLTNSLIKGKGKKKEEEGEVAVFRSYLPSSSTRQSSIRQLAHFPSIEEAMGVDPKSPLGIAAREVWGWFIDHLDSLLESARAFRFDEFEQRLRMFWSNLGTIHREVVHTPVIATLITKTDAIVYDEILEILRSQILSPIEATSLASIRQLGNKMENILLAALDSYNNTFVEIRVVLGARFGHRLLRLLDLYHVTQALNTVLTNTKRLGEMRKSWQNIDFDTIRNQSALVCNCRHEDLQLLEVEFAATLDSLPKSTEPVKEVIAWADNGFERLCVGKSAGKSPSLRSVLIRWSYVMDQIIRDLTIRGDPSSGAFQIVRIFLHDWIGCNVLRSVVLSVNSIEPERQQQSTSLTSTPGALRDVSDLSVAHSTDLSSEKVYETQGQDDSRDAPVYPRNHIPSRTFLLPPFVGVGNNPAVLLSPHPRIELPQIRLQHPEQTETQRLPPIFELIRRLPDEWRGSDAGYSRAHSPRSHFDVVSLLAGGASAEYSDASSTCANPNRSRSNSYTPAIESPSLQAGEGSSSLAVRPRREHRGHSPYPLYASTNETNDQITDSNRDYLQSGGTLTDTSVVPLRATVATEATRRAAAARRINPLKFVCDVCGQNFTAKHNLKNHINSHNKIKNFACECGQSFGTSGVLNRHARICPESKRKT